MTRLKELQDNVRFWEDKALEHLRQITRIKSQWFYLTDDGVVNRFYPSSMKSYLDLFQSKLDTARESLAAADSALAEFAASSHRQKNKAKK